MLGKLALRNVRRQVGNYLIYFMTVSLTVALLFAVSNVIFSENLMRYLETNEAAKGTLVGAVVLISLIVAFVLSYATSFMLKLRKREFGTYLTLGMTRREILGIFLAEHALIGLLALIAGLAAGLLIYQGLTALIMRLLELRFALAAYAPAGLALTVGLVAGIFLLASLTSAIYLKRIRIYELLHGEVYPRTVRHPVLWFLVTAGSLALILGGLSYMGMEAERVVTSRLSQAEFGWIALGIAVSVILFHVGLSRSVIHLLLKQKRLCSRGSNIFVLRALSGTLGSNSLMLGCLAFLLAAAVTGANISFVQKVSQEAELDHNYPYDILYRENPNFPSRITLQQGEKVIQRYGQIAHRCLYELYTSNESTFYERTPWRSYTGLTDSFMKLSDFNGLIVPLGYEQVELAEEYLVVSNVPEAGLSSWDGLVFRHGGRSYTMREARGDYPVFCYQYFYVVVPDEVTEDMEREAGFGVYDLREGPLDVLALKKDLSYLEPDGYRDREDAVELCDYSLREYGRQEQNSTSAILVVAALFTAAVFLFLAMAVLALKILSGLEEDRRRYRSLFRLGAGEREQSRALFLQTFGFFLFPIVMPLLLGIPVAWIGQRIVKAARMEALAGQIPVIAGVIALVMALVYLLYYVAAFWVARRTVVRG